MKHYMIGLIKFVKEEKHAHEFIEGNLYCNRIKYYVDCEAKEIGDAKEAIAYRTDQIRMKAFDSVFYYNLNFRDELITLNPAFCMYAHKITKTQNKNLVKLSNHKLKEWKYAVVIKDANEFLNRLNSNLDSSFESSLIHYTDMFKEKYFEKPIITKDNSFKHQNEFRIYSQNILLSTDEKYSDYEGFEHIKASYHTFTFGNIKDIAEIVSVDKLFDGVEFDFKFTFEDNLVENFSKI